MFAGLGVEEQHFCPFPTGWYPASSPCSEKHNVEDTWIVDTTTSQRKWWEQEETRAKQEAAELDWANMFAPLRTGALLIAAAIAIGLYMNMTKTKSLKQVFA